MMKTRPNVIKRDEHWTERC